MSRLVPTGLAALFFLLSTNGFADIVTDGTVGAVQTLTGEELVVPAELGALHQDNLFHSFAQFSLSAEQSATFTGPESVQRVISRVTGGESSLLDGMITTTMPQADFYFFNPAGILFGPNVYFDLPGSLHFSTADSLQFGDGQEFSATHPESSQFTAASPSAFGFLAEHPAPLTINGSTIQATSGKDLSFTGGEIRIIGGWLVASPGNLVVGGVSGPGKLNPFAGALRG